MWYTQKPFEDKKNNLPHPFPTLNMNHCNYPNQLEVYRELAAVTGRRNGSFPNCPTWGALSLMSSTWMRMVDSEEKDSGPWSLATTTSWYTDDFSWSMLPLTNTSPLDSRIPNRWPNMAVVCGEKPYSMWPFGPESLSAACTCMEENSTFDRWMTSGCRQHLHGSGI